MPFHKVKECPKSWGDFLKRLADLEGEWIFRGALADWNVETSLERACKHWGLLAQMPEVEKKLLREFKRHPETRGLIGDPQDDLEWLALMQHYGTPTRLLDWSYSPFSALFFALDSLLQIDPEKNPTAKAAVWAIRSKWFYEVLSTVLSSSEFDKLKAYSDDRTITSFQALFVEPRTAFVYTANPMFLNERLSVQQGLFLCPGDISQSFEDNLKQLGALTKENARSFIFSRNIMRECFQSLNCMNVSARSLYPGLEGYAKSLKHRIPWLPDKPIK